MANQMSIGDVTATLVRFRRKVYTTQKRSDLTRMRESVREITECIRKSYESACDKYSDANHQIAKQWYSLLVESTDIYELIWTHEKDRDYSFSEFFSRIFDDMSEVPHDPTFQKRMLIEYTPDPVVVRLLKETTSEIGAIASQVGEVAGKVVGGAVLIGIAAVVLPHLVPHLSKTVFVQSHWRRPPGM
jgi:hypothetical protein